MAQLQSMDFILGYKYRKTILQAYDKNILNGLGFGILWKASGLVGTAKRTINKVAATGKCPAIRVHCLWRDDHHFGVSEKKAAIKICKKLARIINKYPDIKWYVSPFLEPSRVDSTLYENTIAACKKVLPEGTKMVASSLEGHKVKGADFTEIHHNNYNFTKDTIFSFDGQECVDSDVEKWKNRCAKSELFFMWSWAFNGKFGSKDNRPRWRRTSWPSLDLIRSIVALTKPKGTTKLPNGWLYKSHSEQYHPPVSRGYKPVWIITQKASKIELKAKNKVVATATYSNSSGGKYYYRDPQWGFKTEKRALRIKKTNGKVGVWVNGKKVGTINPSFRDGYYLGK